MLYEAKTAISVIAHLLHESKHTFDVAGSFSKICEAIGIDKQVGKLGSQSSNWRLIKEILNDRHELPLSVGTLEYAPQVFDVANDTDGNLWLR